MRKEKITVEEIGRLAELSALQFTEKEKLQMVKEVEGILDMLNACEKVSTTSKVGVEKISISDLREDTIGHSISNENALKNAPEHQGGYFSVPKGIER